MKRERRGVDVTLGKVGFWILDFWDFGTYGSFVFGSLAFPSSHY